VPGAPVRSWPTCRARVRLLNALAERLVAGLERHPTRFWAMTQVQQALEAVASEDMRAREFFGEELGRVMDIVGLDDKDGVVAHYLGRP
jgi:hypothetical protein